MPINYKKISETFDNHRSYPRELIEAVIELGRIDEKKKVLDLGCGTGNMTAGLQDLAHPAVFGVDISLAMLERAKAKYLQVLCADIDGKDFPFPDCTFDTIVSTYVLHQIKDLSHFLGEGFRVLRNGPLILLTMSHEQLDLFNPIMGQFFPSAIEVDKARFPDISFIDEILGEAGFGNIRHREVLIEKIPMDEAYLQKARDKYVSTFHLIPQQELLLGIEGLESFIKNSPHTEMIEWRGTLVHGEKEI